MYASGPVAFRDELGDFKEEVPEARETALIEAEVQYNRGLTAEARQAFEALAADLVIASWACSVAQYFLEHL